MYERVDLSVPQAFQIGNVRGMDAATKSTPKRAFHVAKVAIWYMKGCQFGVQVFQRVGFANSGIRKSTCLRCGAPRPHSV